MASLLLCCHQQSFAQHRIVQPGGVERHDDEVEIESPIEIQMDDDGTEWCVISDVSNVPFPGSRYGGELEGAGVVDYEYRLARVEVSIAEFIEFLTVFAPYYDGDHRFTEYTGLLIFGRWNGESWEFSAGEGMDDVPAIMSLRQAARYCNWLHNDKGSEEWAFLTGVYDATTFTEFTAGSRKKRQYQDDYSRAPDARFWIPNVDEWMKGVYYDPNRFGSGQGGWWYQPGGTDDILRWGIPYSIGGARLAPETNSCIANQGFSGYLWTSGQFPPTQTPWGLLDASGGVQEIAFPYSFGSSLWDSPTFYDLNDEAGVSAGHPFVRPDSGSFRWGLRLASPMQ